MRLETCFRSGLFATPFLLASLAAPTFAKADTKTGAPVEFADGARFDPILDMRLRYETVDQDSAANNADALTIRMRAGGEVTFDGLSILAEAEGTLGIINDYNDTIPGNGIEPFPVVADPQNIELNRLQLSYTHEGSSVTIGRQRIIHDNARFVGNVGWRQNEQTFDAVRAQTSIGPVSLDAAYSLSQRTIFGFDSPNQHFDGDFYLINSGVDIGPVKARGFAYLLDYDSRIVFSSQTWGLSVNAALPLGDGKVKLAASYARQSDYKANPVNYAADYFAGSLGVDVRGLSLSAGYEELGSDGGVAAFQTPLATLHAFNGWADMFLTTPAAGLRDTYIGASYALPVRTVSGLKASITWHRFESDFGGMKYGKEWDASLGFSLGPVGLLAKYARYDADAFATDTEKFWLQAEYKF
ncbi:MAG: hypothetical protein ACK5NN_06120 [Sphingomonadaceae bacterium]